MQAVEQATFRLWLIKKPEHPTRPLQILSLYSLRRALNAPVANIRKRAFAVAKGRNDRPEMGLYVPAGP